MQIPLSWLKEFVEIDVPVELLAEMLTKAGLEVSHLHYIGLPQTKVEGVRYPQSDHLVWDRERLLLGAIREVKPHPNADRLVLAMVDYGGAELEQCVTGAPNLFEFKGLGVLPHPLWTAFAAEGAEVWDGHSDTPKRMTLKGKELRGIYNKSMVCSDKELGIAEDHDGVILLREQPRTAHGQPHAPGTPLADVLGDVVLTVELTPNLARAWSVLGVAREIAALLDKDLRQPSHQVIMDGAPINGQVFCEIRQPALNPRFTLMLLRDATIQPSPEWMQWRLKLCGQRPINNIVDVTNYITFEIGQPLHAFDYDQLVARVGGQAPTIITRLPEAGETLETLDQVNRELQGENILVCDTAGVLSLGGIIGGAETEISATTRNVLLEAANWHFINIRRTMQQHKVFTDAGVRFSRGVHPSQAILGVQRGMELMRQTAGGQVAKGVLDLYPQPLPMVQLDLPIREIERITGIAMEATTAADYLSRLGFDVTIEGPVLHVTVPDHRMDIGTGVIGQADLIEEIMRVMGYDAIPTTLLDDLLPEQRNNDALQWEEITRDLLVGLGLRENISYRFTTPDREQALIAPNGRDLNAHMDYVQIANPISPEKSVLRKTLLAGLLDNVRANLRYQSLQRVFEIGSVYFARPDQELPDEPRRLAIVFAGARQATNWSIKTSEDVDFYDLKGVIEGVLRGLHIPKFSFTRARHPSLHPGRSAALLIGDLNVGAFGELHPVIARRFDLADVPVMIAEFDLDLILGAVNGLHHIQPLPITPAILEDIALIVKEEVNAADLERLIWQTGGPLLKDVRLFDVYRGPQLGEGQKSLAFSLTYQTDEKTLNDAEVAAIRKKVVKAAEKQFGAVLRSI
ncbi:MAG: phenylalanine--tRNA ligase subunit beta [Anaerolineae bacterium]|jgi:phenylalanyl-tRNA synthetase beta chain|nr:phenylalanine--tRNA ligase subunit beta [Anaerolineae bacterium]